MADRQPNAGSARTARFFGGSRTLRERFVIEPILLTIAENREPGVSAVKSAVLKGPT
jgi:hypothetical protein